MESKLTDNQNIDNGEPTQYLENSTGKRKVNINCTNLFKIYNQGSLEVIALRRINLKIYAGEIVVVMGPSGSGKTTLLNCLAGLEKPTAGQILLKEYEVNKLNDQGVEMLLQNEIGIIFQFFNLIPSLSAKGNIELPMIIAQRSDKIINRRSKELLKYMGLLDRANQNPFTLSGGEKQRIAIAMAMANDPTIILADEPTGNVDSLSGNRIKNIFVEYIRNNPQKSMIIVTHDSSFLEIADRTLILKDGKIIRELGKKSPYQVNINEINEDLVDILGNDFNTDEINEIINPTENILHYEEIDKCRNCDSNNIRKMYDRKKGDFKIQENQLITRIVVNCDECKHMEYRTASISDINNLNLDI